MFEEGDKGKIRRASGGSNGDGEMGHGSRCKQAHMRFESLSPKVVGNLFMLTVIRKCGKNTNVAS